MTFFSKRQRVLAAVGLSLVFGPFGVASVPATVAQDAEVVEGFPAAVHSGSCDDWVAEPAYDIGVMEETTVAAPGEQIAGISDDGVLDDTDEGFVREDIDDDGVFEVGVDDNDDGILDEDEVLGIDEDDSGFLEEDEVSVLEADTPFPTDFGPVYTVDTDTQFDGNELIDEGPYVVAVHQSAEEYDTLVACGPVVPILEDDNVVVPLRPVDGSAYGGVFLINESDGEVAGFLWETEAAQ